MALAWTSGRRGPAWFLWVLLAFDVLAAALFALAPAAGAYLSRLADGARLRPLRFVAMVVALSLLAYLPMALAVGPMHWATVGPFAVQTSRVLHYLLYFLLGIGVGVYGLDKGLLALDGGLARRWWAWLAGAVVTYVVAVVVVLVVSLSPEPAGAAMGPAQRRVLRALVRDVVDGGAGRLPALCAAVGYVSIACATTRTASIWCTMPS